MKMKMTIRVKQASESIYWGCFNLVRGEGYTVKLADIAGKEAVKVSLERAEMYDKGNMFKRLRIRLGL